MTERLSQVLKKLTPAQLDFLLAQAEQMLNEPHPRGRKLSLNWGASIDSEHESGMEAQKAAMEGWTRAIERNLNL